MHAAPATGGRVWGPNWRIRRRFRRPRRFGAGVNAGRQAAGTRARTSVDPAHDGPSRHSTRRQRRRVGLDDVVPMAVASACDDYEPSRPRSGVVSWRGIVASAMAILCAATSFQMYTLTPWMGDTRDFPVGVVTSQLPRLSPFWAPMQGAAQRARVKQTQPSDGLRAEFIHRACGMAMVG